MKDFGRKKKKKKNKGKNGFSREKVLYIIETTETYQKMRRDQRGASIWRLQI